MIRVEKLNGEDVLINPDHIRFIEKRPDCLITFYDGKTLLVRNSCDEIEQKIIQYKKTVGASWTQQPFSVSS